MTDSSPGRFRDVRLHPDASSLVGGLVGGLVGAAGSVVFGGRISGLTGVVARGLGGCAVGAVIGDALTATGRPLTIDEIDRARLVFGESLDYDVVRITRDRMYAIGSPVTLGATIHLKVGWGHFRGDGLDLTARGRRTLIHEMAHVWQYQNGGLAYIPRSLIAQLRAALHGEGRGGAYDWRAAHREQRPWASWNPEQQAAAAEDYHDLLRTAGLGAASATELADLAIVTGYVSHIRNGYGAPGWKTPDPRR